MNRLYYGDCLTIMQEFGLASVDLIYLDPPFNSNRQYNAIYKDETGRPLPDQIEAFCDMWELDDERERAIRAMPVLMRESGIDDDTAELWRLWMRALRYTQPRLLAYLSYMAQRLLAMHRILKPTGSLYLHCDPTTSHYIKPLLDSIFGHDNFRSEISWQRTSAHNDANGFGQVRDVILYYSKSIYRTWNPITVAHDHSYVERNYRYQDERGRYRHHEVVLTAAMARPNLVYEYEGYMVLDPFCGCATTMEAAQDLGRDWIGIDIAIHAIKRVARVRLTERLGLVEGQDFTVEGVPRTAEGAQDLWERDKYHFQKWAVEQTDGFVTTKRSADGGIDGRVYFAVPHAQDLQSMVIEVKGGKNVSIRDLRALKGVLDYDTALMAGLIVMEPLGTTKARNFARFMGDAGSLEILGIEYPRMQVLTVGEILNGKRFKTPTVAGRHEPQPRMPGIPAVGV